MTGQCPLCFTATKFAFKALVLKKYQVAYYVCNSCGLLRTESPYWLDEAYAEAITRQDTGLVARNITHARVLSPVLDFLYPKEAKFVDIGGGYGLLTRLLRDAGFDTYSTDPFCSPILAPGFAAPKGMKAQALFAFEVLEHIHDPVPFLETVFQEHACRSLIFSTQLYAPPIPSIDWDYYGFEHGQHVALYTRPALELLAMRFGCHYLRLPHGLHWIIDQPPKGVKRLMLSRRKMLYSFHWLQNLMFRRPSLKNTDSRLLAQHHDVVRLENQDSPTDCSGPK